MMMNMTHVQHNQSPLAGSRQRAHASRRGNVLVLVAGILVLLVIIGFSYLSRTRTERAVSTTVQNAGLADSRAEVIGDQLAREIAESLFPRPIDPVNSGANANTAADPNIARLAIEPNALRYSVDRDSNGDGFPDFWWNFAPFHVSAWTNWPDSFIDPLEGTAPRRDDIPGNPGTSDNKWLADIEPVRALLGTNGQFGEDGNLGTPDTIEFFTHWQHMTSLMRPENGWLVVPDIRDIEASVGQVLSIPGPLGPYGTPFEQWLHHTGAGFNPGFFVPADFNTTLGKNYVSNITDFWNRWNDWFFNYEIAYRNGPGSLGIPANYYKLSDCGNDLDNDGFNERLEIGERPQDAFVGPGMSTEDGTVWPEGTPRYNIERVLADTDGDGYTDAFWHMAPVSIDDEFRTLVAARIIDSSAMLNVNVATQFVRGLPSGGFVDHGTRGHTPADLALFEYIGEGLAGTSFLSAGLIGSDPNDFRTWATEHGEQFFPDGGLFDDDVNSPFGGAVIRFDGDTNTPNQWDSGPGSILGELGADLVDDDLRTPAQRLDYWRRAGSRPYDPAPPWALSSEVYTPFTLADELELRQFAASNSGWIQSRLERAFQANDPDENILRGFFGSNNDALREETSEYLDELDVKLAGNLYFDELLHDLRRHLTTFNGARNEAKHQSLWWEYLHTLSNLPDFTDGALAQQRFLDQWRLKLDLRERYVDPTTLDNGLFTMPDRLAFTLFGVLAGEGDTAAPLNRHWYYENYPLVPDRSVLGNDYAQSARLAAGFAANILSYRDFEDYEGLLAANIPAYGFLEDEAVRVPRSVGDGTTDEIGRYHDTRRFLGMEMQPFLVEAFIGHFYESVTAQFDHPNSIDSAVVPGDRVVVADDPNRHSVVVVQIANPYDRDLYLDQEGVSPFRIRVFGNDYILTGDPLKPGESRTYWSISADTTEILDALDLEVAVLDVYELEQVPTEWSTDRTDYDTGNPERAIELIRQFEYADSTTADMVIDRIDLHADGATGMENFDVGTALNGLVIANHDTGPEPAATAPWDVINLGSTDDRFVQWVRVSRDFDRDIDGSGVIEDDEQNPRYVFSLREVTTFNSLGGFDSSLPANDWLTKNLAEAKPTRFLPLLSTNTADPNFNEPDLTVGAPFIKDVTLAEGTGANQFIELDFSMSMAQKDGDFEQIGELLNVFTYGHALLFQNGLDRLDTTPNHGGTLETFSEFMVDGNKCGMDLRVNRLKTEPTESTFQTRMVTHSDITGISSQFNDLRRVAPDLPAGARLLDLFVCDDAGYNARYIDADGDGTIGGPLDFELLTYGNAQRFAFEATPGQININTTPREVLRAPPHAYRLAHETLLDDAGSPLLHLNPFDASFEPLSGRTHIAEAIEAYRERQGDIPIANGGMNPFPNLPMYGGRGLQRLANIPDAVLNDSRGGRGFESIGELALLTKQGRITGSGRPEDDTIWNQGWNTGFAALNPLRDPDFATTLVDLDLSTDVLDSLTDLNGTGNIVDETAADVEERNLIFSGLSNLVTTRSDSFIVYFRVRQVRRDAATGVWNAMDPESIMLDKRYMMIVDRSNVDRVTDQPRILMFQEIAK